MHAGKSICNGIGQGNTMPGPRQCEGNAMPHEPGTKNRRLKGSCHCAARHAAFAARQQGASSDKFAENRFISIGQASRPACLRTSVRDEPGDKPPAPHSEHRRHLPRRELWAEKITCCMVAGTDTPQPDAAQETASANVEHRTPPLHSTCRNCTAMWNLYPALRYSLVIRRSTRIAGRMYCIAERPHLS